MPYTRSVTASAREGGMRVASNPMSPISYIAVRRSPRYPGERLCTDIDNFVCVPDIGIVLDDTALSQQRDFDGMDAGLIPEHALYRLRN